MRYGRFSLFLFHWASKHTNASGSYMPFGRVNGRSKDGKELIQCPTPGCDGVGHITGNYATHRR